MRDAPVLARTAAAFAAEVEGRELIGGRGEICCRPGLFHTVLLPLSGRRLATLTAASEAGPPTRPFITATGTGDGGSERRRSIRTVRFDDLTEASDRVARRVELVFDDGRRVCFDALDVTSGVQGAARIAVLVEQEGPLVHEPERWPTSGLRLDRIAATLEVAASPTRLRLLAALSGRSLSEDELGEGENLAGPAVREHLGAMMSAGLIMQVANGERYAVTRAARDLAVAASAASASSYPVA